MNQLTKRRLAFIAGFVFYFGALWTAWDTALVYPLKIFVVLLHEISHAAVAVAPGQCVWIGIQGQGGEDPSQCYWLWTTAPPGDERSWQFNAPEPLRDFDLTICVNNFIAPDGCTIAGACCDEDSGACVDDVAMNDCTGRYAAACSLFDDCWPRWPPTPSISS